MKQLQLACSNDLGCNPFVNEMSIAYPVGLNPIYSLFGGVTNHSTLNKYILNPLSQVLPGLLAGSPLLSYQVAQVHIIGVDCDFPLAIDATSLQTSAKI